MQIKKYVTAVRKTNNLEKKERSYRKNWKEEQKKKGFENCE